LLAAATTATQIPSTPVGHEYREDNLPFAGNRDDVAIRRYDGARWSNIHWVPRNQRRQLVAAGGGDAAGRVWVVWSQQSGGNWDICARRFDPRLQEWSALERLSTHPVPDINPRVWSDGKGRAALVWQGFRGRNSNIFLRTLEGDRWSAEVRVTHRAANDWDPAVAIDSVTSNNSTAS
jgi:hypothetical protein